MGTVKQEQSSRLKRTRSDDSSYSTSSSHSSPKRRKAKPGTLLSRISSERAVEQTEFTGPRVICPSRKWCQDEDKLLLAAVEQHGAKNWKHIAKHVPGRDHIQCLQRYKKVLKP